jgi:hypothetical protein
MRSGLGAGAMAIPVVPHDKPRVCPETTYVQLRPCQHTSGFGACTRSRRHSSRLDTGRLHTGGAVRGSLAE